MAKDKLLQQNKVIVILGSTSSGKSEAAIRLAKKHNGEIISADSRQIYRGMDIGTGKIARDFSVPSSKLKVQSSKFNIYYSNGIPHYLIDIVSSKTDYNVSNFKKDAEEIIANILSRGKLPVICGGTGFWIKAVVDNVNFPEVKPDQKLRKKMDKKSITELIQELKKLDPRRAKEIDKNNKVRLIRAIEIARTLGSVPRYKIQDTRYNFLQIGINIPKEKLQQNIKKRLAKRWRAGMVKEVQKLKKSGLSWKKIQGFGLAYFWIPLFLQKKISKEELFEKTYLAEKNYAKRQITWFQRDKRIKWLRNYKDIEKESIIFLKNSGHQ